MTARNDPMTRLAAAKSGSSESASDSPVVAAYRPGCAEAYSWAVPNIAATAAFPDLPCNASRSASPNSVIARTAIRRRRSSIPSTCL